MTRSRAAPHPLLLATLALASCGGTRNDITLRPVPAACSLAGPVDHLVVSALGDLAPGPGLSATVAADGTIALGPLPQAVRVLTVEGFAADGTRVGIGQTAPFLLGQIANGPMAVAYGAPDSPCASVGPLHAPRWGHLATPLQSGLLLITGGRDAGGPVTTLELYDPAFALFVRAGDLDPAMAIGHTATPLADSTLLIAGGAGEDGPASNRSAWFVHTGAAAGPTGLLGEARAFHSAVILPGAEILLSGGCSEVRGDDCAPGTLLATSELYDPSSRTYRPGPPLLRGRSHHQAILRSDGTVLIAGGRIEGGAATDGEIVDPVASHAIGAILPAAPMAALDAGGVVLAGGELVAASAVLLLPSPTEAPLPLGALGSPRARPTVTRFLDGDVLVVGGADQQGAASGAVDLIDAAGAVRALAPTLPRVGHTATLLPDGSVVIIGGRDASGAPRGDAQLFVHSLLGPHAAPPAQTFTDGEPGLLLPRRPDRMKRAGGMLSLTAPDPGDGRPPELALVRGMAPLTVEVSVRAGRGVEGVGAAVIVGWLGDASYLYVEFQPGIPVRVGRVVSNAVGASLVVRDSQCTGETLGEAQLPVDDLALLRVVSFGTELQAWTGSKMVLNCVPSGGVPRGLVGVGTLGGEVLFDDLTAVRR
ncbi:MAG: hypothetical protein EXR72_13115 [Myxococcales bacterium]|nr:hypothetical protein [Myxococcales bacterium]